MNPTTKACTTSRNISKVTSNTGNSAARSFLLSPDKTKVAFHVADDATDTQHVEVAPVDGSSDAVDMGAASSFSQGPRWVAGGAFLSWGVLGSSVDGGMVGSNSNYAIVTAQVGSDAGPRTAVVATDAVGTVAINQSTCSFGAGIGSGVSGFGFLGLLGLRLVRRRNKKA